MINMELYKQQVEEARDFLDNLLDEKPTILIQLGTGLGNLIKAMEVELTIAYEKIPHFPKATVESHGGNLVIGKLAGKMTAILQGRFHYYEGYSTLELTFPIRVLTLLGVKTAIITNAAGGLNKKFKPGALMIFKDHLNFLGENPLRGPNIDEWGPRFPDLSIPYDPELRTIACQAATALSLTEVLEGTYVCIPGPSLETPAETRLLKNSGADAVGMSSVPEVLVARHGGLRVLGLSVVANCNDPDDMQTILLEDVIQAAEAAAPKLQALIIEIMSRLFSSRPLPTID